MRLVSKAQKTLRKPQFIQGIPLSGVFAPLVGASVFKTAGGLEESPQWVRFPYTPDNGPVAFLKQLAFLIRFMSILAK
jgi:hypothetical protein